MAGSSKFRQLSSRGAKQKRPLFCWLRGCPVRATRKKHVINKTNAEPRGRAAKQSPATKSYLCLCTSIGNGICICLCKCLGPSPFFPTIAARQHAMASSFDCSPPDVSLSADPMPYMLGDGLTREWFMDSFTEVVELRSLSGTFRLLHRQWIWECLLVPLLWRFELEGKSGRQIAQRVIDAACMTMRFVQGTMGKSPLALGCGASLHPPRHQLEQRSLLLLRQRLCDDMQMVPEFASGAGRVLGHPCAHLARETMLEAGTGRLRVSKSGLNCGPFSYTAKDPVRLASRRSSLVGWPTEVRQLRNAPTSSAVCLSASPEDSRHMTSGHGSSREQLLDDAIDPPHAGRAFPLPLLPLSWEDSVQVWRYLSL